ncbi:putative GPI-anchor transamidase [Chionoecetes opilio]|uniref:Putative GPI-anchor transamidase n=1 Tax=Chionoecetes opilio TaxID=41210 RepID=A0A8J5CY05_CHIOP|nr:putative GPI-anchor transamidase [Chionoecetes opilio]
MHVLTVLAMCFTFILAHQVSAAAACACLCKAWDQGVSEKLEKTHTNNWAVLVDTSRFWFNYRHVANVLSMYRSVKRLGIPDSQIILMVADDMACNPRNPRPATVFNNAHQHINVYGEDVEVDYRGYEVTVENFVRLLTGRLAPSTPRSKRLLTDDGSNILIYMTGHGGDGFLKFQDSEEITNVELADAFEQMWQKKRYNEILFIIDTCQAASMYEHFYSPNILAIASSLVGEDSLSHHVDPAIGVYIIDRFTYYALEFLERVTPDSKKTLAQFLQVCPKRVCISTVGVRRDLYKRDPSRVLVTEFFGSVRNVELTSHILDLPHCGGPRQVAINKSIHTGSTKSKKQLHYANQLPIHHS